MGQRVNGGGELLEWELFGLEGLSELGVVIGLVLELLLELGNYL